MDFCEKGLHPFPHLFIREKGFHIFRNNRPNAFNRPNLFRIGRHQGGYIVLKIPAQKFCIGEAHIGDSKAVNKTGRRYISGFLHGLNEVRIGFFSHAFHVNNLFFMIFQMKYILQTVNKALLDKFLQRCFRQSFNIKSVPGYKKG